MKIKTEIFKHEFEDFDGKKLMNREPLEKGGIPVLDSQNNLIMIDTKPITLRQVCIQAILAMTDEKLDWEKKVEHGHLAKFINDSIKEEKTEIELKTNNITFIKECIGKVYGKWITTIACDLLEGKTDG